MGCKVASLFAPCQDSFCADPMGICRQVPGLRPDAPLWRAFLKAAPAAQGAADTAPPASVPGPRRGGRGNFASEAPGVWIQDLQRWRCAAPWVASRLNGTGRDSLPSLPAVTTRQPLPPAVEKRGPGEDCHSSCSQIEQSALRLSLPSESRETAVLTIGKRFKHR